MRLNRIAGTAMALALSAAWLTAQTTSTDAPKTDQKKSTTAKPPEKTAAADSNPDKAKGAPMAAPDEKAMMEAMAKAATPGEPHKQLTAMAGTWDAKIKMWMKPGDPPAESAGTATRTAVLGGRYLEEKFDGTFMGQPFAGQGMTGYDNVTGKYVGTWADTMSTGVMNTTGAMDKGGKSVTFKGSMVDPMTKKASPFRQKMTMNDADHQTLEMWGAGPDGKNYKMMEIAYTRKK
jgi:hypothetical protein